MTISSTHYDHTNSFTTKTGWIHWVLMEISLKTLFCLIKCQILLWNICVCDASAPTLWHCVINICIYMGRGGGGGGQGGIYDDGMWKYILTPSHYNCFSLVTFLIKKNAVFPYHLLYTPTHTCSTFLPSSISFTSIFLQWARHPIHHRLISLSLHIYRFVGGKTADQVRGAGCISSAFHIVPHFISFP